ncbi:MAG TPA: amidohydrolase family protein [Casimicrobiaceae bacterium]|nr:amidohydrolase family protein [Casimicrobiaceae bacterium]
MSRFRTVEQIERSYATAHLEANVSADVYSAFIAARNRGDSETLRQLDADHGTETLLQEAVKFRSTTFFSTALKEGCRQLYAPAEGWDALMRAATNWGAEHPSYAYDQATKVAKTPIVLTDVPFIDREVWDPQRYRQITRIDPYLYPFHSGEAPGRGTEFQRFHGVFSAVLAAELKHYGLDEPPRDLDGYLQFVDASVRRRVSEGAIGLKIVSAYVRSIEFGAATYANASNVYGMMTSGSVVDSAPLENFLVRRLAQYAADNRLPMQIHVGMGHPEPGMLIANSAPFLLESFLNTPSLNRLKVILLHGGYPFSSHVAALAQTYGNVYLDFSWMPYLHHFYLRTKLSEWLEILPANKLLYGSDTSAPEFHVAAASYTRESLNHVLNDGYLRNVWNSSQVDWLAQRILFENTADVYRIDSDVSVTPPGDRY